ncbi:sensor histidine kinase [Chitinophaga filiformis]|uniref:Sensor histidine kinase n=1 Tax=Chitinophaga filiformis TaxID=104663 RepID=A0ABY4I9V5_CHIFI|nr:histidine kinase [Chitinophaga filiformis]UPK72129.1 sensor histidine kinase [Chitinophaga filiformis]
MLKVNYRRLLLLTLFSLFIYGAFFFLSYVVDPGRTTKEFTNPWNLLLFVVESVITHYILIFKVIIPAMHKERKYSKLLMITILLFLIKFILNYGYFLIQREHNVVSTKTSLSLNSMSWLLLIVYVFNLITSFSIALLVEWVRKGKERIMLEKQRTEAELSALKHQINPHFLFNSLSFIYGKVIKLNKETADSILILANIMRYALGKSDATDGQVSIMDELEHMKNVVEINQRRHNRQLHIQYEEQIDDQSIRIIPLVLITLVENAFKHGDLHNAAHPLLIKVCTNVNEFSFDIRNKKGKGIKELSNGVGLQNISQRLSLTYGHRCSFILQNEEQFFSVSLKINWNI